MKSLLDCAQEVKEAALANGCNNVEVSISSGRDLGVEFEGSSIKNVDVAQGQNLFIRAFHNGGKGTLSIEGFSREDVKKYAQKAANMARYMPEDPDFHDLPHFEKRAEVPNLYDPAVEKLGVTDVVQMAIQLIEESKEVNPDAVVSGGVGVSIGESYLVNSNDVCISKRGTHLDLSVFVVVKRGDDVGSFYDVDMGRSLADIRVDGLGRNTCKKAQTFLGAKKTKSKKIPVILGPFACYSFLRSIARAAYAEDIQRKRSFFTDRLHTRVASDVITINDDPFIPGGLSSGTYDGEGALRKKICVIEKGMLKELYHNSYTAGKEGIPNNGHGTKGGGIGATNLIPTLGTMTSEQIIADTQEGILIEIGSPTPDMISGNISSLVDFGYKIENGTIAYPVVNTMIGGDIFEFLAGIDAISSDYRSEPGLVMPTLRIRDVQIS